MVIRVGEGIWRMAKGPGRMECVQDQGQDTQALTAHEQFYESINL